VPLHICAFKVEASTVSPTFEHLNLLYIHLSCDKKWRENLLLFLVSLMKVYE
jgi:hypothetical protein